HWKHQDELRRGRERPPLDGRAAVLHRAKLYVAKEPPAISGEHGHDRCFHVACVLVQGFDLTTEDALQAIQDWNQTRRPPWSEAELRHKLEDAAKNTDRPRGYLRDANGRGGANGRVPEPVAAAAPGSAPATAPPPAPAPWEPAIPLA